jgi:hypothetical protein
MPTLNPASLPASPTKLSPYLSTLPYINDQGSFLYVQLKVQQHATFHVEVITSRDTVLRITVSTVYAEDKARFLGSSLRFVINQ